jgi:hypothetical protein
LFLAKTITTNTLGVHKIQDLPLKQLSISPKSWKDPGMTQPIGDVCPEKKAPWQFLPFLSFSFVFKKQTLCHPGPLTHGKPAYTLLC